MENIWKDLPYDMVREILGHVDDIDVRLAFHILPKRIHDSKICKIEWLLNTHDGLIYNLESSTLHNFMTPGCHYIRRPFKLDFFEAGRWHFNLERREHVLELIRSDGSCIIFPEETTELITRSRVLLKGSGIAKTINFPGTT